MLADDLPKDLPTFVARFGTDEQCHAYLVQKRWPDGFCCRACGHREAWRLGRRNLYECAACGQQHSLLKGTIFERTKSGLAKWFLAIYLVTASKGGNSAMSSSARWVSAAIRPPGPGCTRSAARWSAPGARRSPRRSRRMRPMSAAPSPASPAAAAQERGRRRR